MNNIEHQAANDIVIFGALGDLSRRKLLPSLFQLDSAGLLHDDLRIICVARQEHTNDSLVDVVKTNFEAFVSEDMNDEVYERFLSRLVYQRVNLTDSSSYQGLSSILKPEHINIYYFSTSPSLFGEICDGLHLADLIQPNDRVVMEKPIGHCLETSKVINDQVARFFNENQIYRIDHYLGKETVLNLLVLRFGNSLFTTNWDRNSIDHVQITVAESVGIEGRWGYFDDAGQMRDMVQNHLLQIVSLLAMEPPADLSADSIRDEKLKALKALVPINRSNIKDKTVRGQYTEGFLKGEPVPGYLQEEGANKNSNTESFVAIKAEFDNWRWSGVPFYLRTGKRMPTKHSEIVIQFKEQPHNIFKDSYNELPANKLTIRLQPDEGIELQVMNKIPGIASQMQIHENKLDLSFSDTYGNERVIDAYERLILEVVNGNQALFVRRDEVEAAWTWADGIISAWNTSNDKPKPYAAGSWGPVSSISLIARDNRQWVE